MRVDFNGIVKSTKGLTKNAAVFVSKNKHAFIEGGLAGVLGAVGIDSFMNIKKKTVYIRRKFKNRMLK